MSTSGPTESSLLLVIAEAEASVREHRAKYDLAARVGVPAHITVAYPFEPAEEIDTDDLACLQEISGGTAPFDIELTRTGWFGGDVLFLAPTASEPIVSLTRRVEAAFPQFPIYGGAFENIQPHLTIGHHGGEATLRQIETDSVRACPSVIT
ncbi:2'-5' RNA ligase family protein [Mariniluteicoccus flavus]